MTTALFLLRCVQIGLGLDDLEMLTIGMVDELFIESNNDTFQYDTLATQADFDRF